MGHRIDTRAAGRPNDPPHSIDIDAEGRLLPGAHRRRHLPTVRRIIRAAAVLIAVVVAVELVSGCAVALRALAVADVIVTLDEATQDPDEPQDAAAVGPLASVPAVRARVAGTRSGLWVNEEPGAGRLFAVPEGTAVTVHCRAGGPTIHGSQGWTSSWSHVTTDDGRSGFMSDAYLVADLGAEVVPCTG